MSLRAKTSPAVQAPSWWNRPDLGSAFLEGWLAGRCQAQTPCHCFFAVRSSARSMQAHAANMYRASFRIEENYRALR